MTDAHNLIRRIKESFYKRNSSSNMFDAQWVGMEKYDKGMVVIKFANANKDAGHNKILKESPTKFMIAIKGFDKDGRVKNLLKTECINFHHTDGNDVMNEESPLAKRIQFLGNIEESFANIDKFFIENNEAFTAPAKIYSEVGSFVGQEEEIKEEAVASAPSATVGSLGTFSAAPVGTASGFDSEGYSSSDSVNSGSGTRSGDVSRVKTKMGMKKRKKKLSETSFEEKLDEIFCTDFGIDESTFQK